MSIYQGMSYLDFVRDDIAEAVENNTPIAVHTLHTPLAIEGALALLRSINRATGINLAALCTWGFREEQVTHVLIYIAAM